MNGLDGIAKQLFEKIRGRFPKIVMGDENGAPTADESQARFFDFDWIVNGENQGAVSISIQEGEALKIYYSQNMLENLPETVETEWYNFLKEVRFFAKKHMMGFDTRDIAKSNLDKRDYQYLANKQVQESTMYGTTKSSYEELDKTKLIIRHKKEITPEQAGARTRHISSLFIENEAGERFKYPFAHLAGARAMARHVANGGLPHDEFGSHIIETSQNIAKLTAFKRYVGKKDFMNTTSSDIIEGSNVELENLRTHIKRLQGQQYYTNTKENFTPAVSGDTELGEDVVNELTNAFTIPQFNEDLTDMFPLLHSIHQKRVAETTLDLDDVVKESNDPKVDAFLQKVATADDEGFDMLYDANSGKYGDAIYKAVGDMYNDVAVDNGYHPDDDFEKIYDRMLDNIEADYGPKEDLDEFESWADSVMDEALDKQKIAMLNKMLGKTLPVGPDATNAINSLKGIIDDEGLMNELKDLAENDPESCARPAIYRYIQNNDPEVLDNLDFGDMNMEDDTTDVTIDKDGAMQLPSKEEPKDEKASTEDIIEYVRSFYDTETGAFPKGETGVVISARKRFGDSVGDLVEKFVSKLTGKKVQVEDEEGLEEADQDMESKILDWAKKYETRIGNNGDTLPEGYLRYLISTGIFSDAYDQDETAKAEKMIGKPYTEWDYDDQKKALDMMPITKAMFDEIEKITGTSGEDAAEMVADVIDNTNEDADKDNMGFSDKEIKMAFGVLNDKRFKGGNYTGAVGVIEKIAKGLSKHPSVAKALARTNEVTESRKAPAEVKKLMAGHTYTCEDCGCKMHNCKPDCDCKHDSHDEMGSWWKDENGNGIPDVKESKNEDLDYITDKLAKLLR